MSIPTTEQPAYDRAIECLEMGQVPACVPIRYGGETGIWTTSGTIDPEMIKTDLDILAVAIVSIQRAYKEAFKAGATAIL